MATNSKKSRLAAAVSEWNARHPVLAIVLVSLLAVMINCYPVVFLGRSYVSPACVGPMVYSWWPPLPGMAPGPVATVRPHGSDTQATMWWGVPMGFVESRSLLAQGEFPLWNRHNHGGETLIGQGISMLGDPLQWIVILGRGSAIAWDFKYLTAKFLFCVGFGLLVRRLLESQPLGLIFAALSAYCGAFFYINNHPVFFVFAYAPWILLSAIELLDLHSQRYFLWGLLWLLASFAGFNAGHIEVAVVLLAGLNMAALVRALAVQPDASGAARVLGRMAMATLLFLGLAAPLWLSFMSSLEGAFTSHAGVNIVQLPPTTLPGVFDDLFYLLLRADEATDAFAPGTSLLVLTGCSMALWRWRQSKGDAFFWINTAAIVLWAGCVFGWVPAAGLARIPLLNRVGHVYTDFSYLLVLHLTIQSAYGFRCLAKVEQPSQLAGDVACTGAFFAGLLLLYSFGYAHHPIPWNYFFCAGAGAIGAPLLFVFLKQRQRLHALGWAGVVFLAFLPNFRFGLYHLGNDSLLMVLGPRVTLNAPSRAIDEIKADPTGAFRTVGLEGCLSGNYSATYGLEDISSSSPLGNMEFMNLIRQFPGMELQHFWQIEVVDPARAQLLLNLFNVKYLLAPPDAERVAPPGFRLVAGADFNVWENLEVWPRAFFTDRVVPVTSTGEFIQQLMHNGPRPFAALAPEEIAAQPGLRELATRQPEVVLAATHYELLANSTAFEVHAPTAGVVCLAESQARDFTATANGEPKAVLTVNRAFKGIYLDRPGDYQVRFTYRPRHWQLAWILFFAAAGAVTMLAGLHACRTRLPGPPASPSPVP